MNGVGTRRMMHSAAYPVSKKYSFPLRIIAVVLVLVIFARLHFIKEDELLVELFDEVKRIWPMLGTPCLVTPFSQYVKNAALMNIFSKSMGEKPFTRLDPNTWDMILGKSGKLPGEVDPEIIALAKEKGFEFTDADPQSY